MLPFIPYHKGGNMVSVVRTLDAYEYSNTAFIGVPTQPHSVNVFTLTQTEMRQCTLIPWSRAYLHKWFDGTPVGIRTMGEALDQIGRRDGGIIAQNFFRGLLGLIPIIGSEIIKDDAHRTTHCTEAILNHPLVKKKSGTDIAGVAIEGDVIYTLEATKIDNLSKSIAQLEDPDRLILLTEHVKAILLEEANEKPLRPVRDILHMQFSVLDNKPHNPIHLSEIEARVARLDGDSLTERDAVRLVAIGRSVTVLALNRLTPT